MPNEPIPSHEQPRLFRAGDRWDAGGPPPTLWRGRLRLRRSLGAKRGEGVRNLGRKPLIKLDSEKEMQGNANVLSLFSTSETASTPAAARS